MIQAVQGLSGVPWVISTLIEDVCTWIRQMPQVHIHHIYREANMAADWLSKFGHTITDCFSSDTCSFSELSSILTADVVGRTLVRRGA